MPENLQSGCRGRGRRDEGRGRGEEGGGRRKEGGGRREEGGGRREDRGQNKNFTKKIGLHHKENFVKCYTSGLLYFSRKACQLHKSL